jgi:hypothetical protein
MIPDYELQYEINTNRTECEYHVNIMRTLSHKVYFQSFTLRYQLCSSFTQMPAKEEIIQT